MMMSLLVLKSKIKGFYERHYRVARGVLKVFVMFAALMTLTEQLGYGVFAGQYLLLGTCAVLCGVTPDGVSIALLLLVTCGETAGVSVLLAATILAVVVIYILLYGRFEKRQYYLIFLVPLLSSVQIGYVVPIVAALFVPPVMLPALCMGILLQYMMQGVVDYASAMTGVAEPDNMLSSLQYLVDYLLQNKFMFVMILAYCLTFMCIYMIRRGKVKHGSQIAILVGGIVLMAVEMLCNIVWEMNVNLALLTLQVTASMAIAYVVQFFHMTLDYHGTRKLQFEDDEYYYYVTAVPKFKVAVEARTVTRILPDEEDENFDLKEELEKALQEEEAEMDSDSI